METLNNLGLPSSITPELHQNEVDKRRMTMDVSD